jgi:phosphopantothenoylcysteine decarboxylase/phosphopantothenate--cysteine ligase
MIDGKRVLLIIGGGIAAYKCLELIRRLRERGVGVAAILTRAGAQFVTPLSIASLSGERVHTELFDLTAEVEIGHIELSRSADLLVVAPATADLLAKMAHGHADDLATTTLLATDTPVLVAPAMNVRMWLHPATQRNLASLRHDGIAVIGPNEGEMACNEYGPGRLAEPSEILAAVEQCLARSPAGKVAPGEGARPLAGCTVLITAGPTREPIDPVRYIANRSSGKQGYAIAAAAVAEGAKVVLVSGPTHLPLPEGAHVVPVESAEEMLQACREALPADVAIFTAAVADWRVKRSAADKIKKQQEGPPKLELVENPDILKTIANLQPGRPALVIGFAAETADVTANARKKLDAKGCDWVVANDVSPGTGIMGGERNAVQLVTRAGVEHWPDLPKAEVARRLMRRITEHLAAAAKAAE